MSHLRCYKWYAGCLLACVAGRALPVQAQFADPEYTDTFAGNPATNAFIRIPKDTDDWTRHFRLGAMVGMNLKANFAMSGNAFSVNGNNPAAGKFDDGYVYKDQSGDSTYTGYWGYNNASQVSGNTLTLHANTGFSASASGIDAQSSGGILPGLDLAYGDNLWYWRHARVGWELGFGWLPMDFNSSINQSGLTVNQSAYTFNTGGIVVPGAPYLGGPGGSGEPIINRTPTGTSTSTTTGGTLTGNHALDVDLFTLRLGPSFYWDLCRRLSLDLGAGPAVGFVTGEYKYNETITLEGSVSQNNGQISDTVVVYGGYVNATFLYHIEHDADLYLGAQYMPMTDATISGGGRSGTVDLGGQLYFMFGINWAF
jgi:hypothetical protein